VNCEEAPVVVSVDRYNREIPAVSQKAVIARKTPAMIFSENYGRDSDYYRWSQPLALIRFQTEADRHETKLHWVFGISQLAAYELHCINETWQLATASVSFGYDD